jgi:hypothetical protein
MRGDLRGDFSRLRFTPKENYTSVLQQQGRVQLDADANEQCAINEHIRGAETIDIVGPYGGPEADAGFAITVGNNSIQIGLGRYYVEGLLCENVASLGYTQQPYLINPPLSDSVLLSDLQKGTYSAIQVFLEVWQRLVTSLDDPCLLEPALGLADTTARMQIVWRVVAEPVAPAPLPSPILTQAPVAATELAVSELTAVAATSVPAASLGAPQAAAEAATSSPIAALPDCCVTMYQPPPPLPLHGTMGAQTRGAGSDCSCQPTPAAGFQGMENQLYRVEIHRGGTESTATFKWSRENFSVVVGVTGVSGAKVMVDSLGFDANLGFASGQWVEISDDADLFGLSPNQPGQLYQIQSITPGQLVVTVTSPVSAVNPALNARLRRCDQSGASAGPNGIPVSTSWIDIESGIQVQFSAGSYTTGDYWLIPARTASGKIDWPPCGGDGLVLQPPHEIDIFRAPLACIHWGTNRQFNVEDCRRLFPPLTSVAGGPAPALHVTKISWRNDDVVAFDQLLATGLTVSLDQAPTGLIDSSIFSITLEVPVVSPIETEAVLESLAPIVLRTSMPLDGQITVQTTNITWNLPFRDSTGAIPRIQLEALVALDLMFLQGVSYSSFARARVRLRGRDISAASGSSPIFLDGQAFGVLGKRIDGVTNRTDLTFPSGAAAKASDFESWFFIAPTLTVVSLSVSPATVVLTTPAVTAATPAVTAATPAVTAATPAVTAATPAVTPAKPAVAPAAPAVTPAKPAVAPAAPAATPAAPAATPAAPAATPAAPAATPATPAATPATPAATPATLDINLENQDITFANTEVDVGVLRLLPSSTSPKATLTVNYPALVPTVVTLSVIPPATIAPSIATAKVAQIDSATVSLNPVSLSPASNISGAVSVPATVTVPQGQISVSFTVTLRNTGVTTPETFEIVASLTNALGITSTVNATVTVTGFLVTS